MTFSVLFTDAAKEEQYLHIDWLAARTDRSSNGVEETKITSTES
jgi:hypothetical protein